MPSPATASAAFAGPEVRQRVHEALELLRRPALEHAVAVGLVGADHAVAVVPVELRLGVHPEGAAGARADRPERALVGLAAVRAGVAEDDDRLARVEVVDHVL